MQISLVCFHILCYDIWFYCVHRALHLPALYSRYHFQHHAHKYPSWYHAFTAHALENALSSLGLFVPLVLTQWSADAFVTAWLVCLARGIARHDNRLPLSAHHLEHHVTPTCNFSAAYIDYMFGTLKT